MKGKETGRGRKKGLTFLLIFIWSTLEKKKRLLRVQDQFFSTVFINPDRNTNLVIFLDCVLFKLNLIIF